MTEQELTQTIKVLRKEVEVLTSRLKPHATGYIHTALDVINGRIDELIKEVTAPFFEDDVYDGYAEHTEAMEQARLRKLGSSAYQRAGAMEQARLRKIQDSAAGRKPDIQNMSSDGLYERSMKQKYGRAVMTVSEQMQEELEPLPINTFE